MTKTSKTISNKLTALAPATLTPTDPKLHIMKLSLGTQPVGYVAYTAAPRDDGSCKVEFTVNTLSPNDVWNTKLGLNIVKNRFAVLRNRTGISKAVTSLAEARKAILMQLATDQAECSFTAQKAAKSMLDEITGKPLTDAVTSFFATSSTKKAVRKLEFLKHLVTLVEQDVNLKVANKQTKKSTAKKK